MIVIADSGPVRYLVLIEQIHLLQLLYGGVVIPRSVVMELTRTATPQAVREWMDVLPEWVTIRSPQQPFVASSIALGLGEQEAIALAQELAADVLLVDDEAARREAEKRNIPVQGTLGVLDLAAEHDLLADFSGTIQKLGNTNFRASAKLLEFFMERDAGRKERQMRKGS